MLSKIFKRPADVQITKDTTDPVATASGSSAREVREEPLAPVAGRPVKSLPRRFPWTRLFKRKAAFQLTKDDPEEPKVQGAQVGVRQEPLPEVEGRVVRRLPEERLSPEQKRRRELNEFILTAISRAVAADKYKDLKALLTVLIDEYKAGLEGQDAPRVEEMDGDKNEGAEASASRSLSPKTSAEGDLKAPKAEEEGADVEKIEEKEVESSGSARAEDTEAHGQVETGEGITTTLDIPVSAGIEEPAAEAPAQETDHGDSEQSQGAASGESQSSVEAATAPSTPPLLFGGVYGPVVPLGPLIFGGEPGEFHFGTLAGEYERPTAHHKDASLMVHHDGDWEPLGKGDIKLLGAPERVLRLVRPGTGETRFEIDLRTISKPRNGFRAIQFETNDLEGVRRRYALMVPAKNVLVAAMVREWTRAQEATHE